MVSDVRLLAWRISSPVTLYFLDSPQMVSPLITVCDDAIPLGSGGSGVYGLSGLGRF